LVDLFEYMMMHGLTNPKQLNLFINYYYIGGFSLLYRNLISSLMWSVCNFFCLMLDAGEVYGTLMLAYLGSISFFKRWQLK